MIELSRHIEILLLSNDCVIVPDFGGFMTHYVSARYDKSDHSFLPPLRTLGFNQQLKLNDHLLVQSYVEAYDISYPEALRRIQSEVEEMKQHIENEGKYELNGLGVLSRNDNGVYEFEPYEAGILTPELYGLGSFEIAEITEILKTDSTKTNKTTTVVLPQTEKEDIVADKEHEDNSDVMVVKLSWVRNLVATAAAILLFFVISTPIDNSVVDGTLQQSSMLSLPTVITVVDEEAENETEITLSENSAEQENSEVQACVGMPEMPIPENCSDLHASSTPSYSIVLASQTPLRHAEEFIARLAKKNITDVHIMSMINTQKVRVVYSQFSSEDEAVNALRSLRSAHSELADAWVLKVN